MSFTVDPVFSLLAIAALALLFATAAVAKIRDRVRFAAVLETYEVMPRSFTRGAAVWLPFIELTVAFGLFVTQVRPVAAAAAAGLLFIYGAAMGVNLARGRRHIDCGCEGFGRRRSIAPWMLVRNGVLMVVAAVAGATSSTRAIEWTDALTIAGGLAAFAMIYFAADHLLASRRAT
ncbi:MAG: MauE/DoxX family redox-associated membrane protein [Steroidobacterales bacterium]